MLRQTSKEPVGGELETKRRATDTSRISEIQAQAPVWLTQRLGTPKRSFVGDLTGATIQ